MQKINTVKTLYLLHRAMFLGQVVFAAICIFLVYTKKIQPPAQELERVLQVAALIITVVGVYAGMTVFKKKLLEISRLQTGVKEKLALYRNACIVQWALLEGPCLCCIISFFLTGNDSFLALATVILFLFIRTAPSKNKISLQVQINESDLEDL